MSPDRARELLAGERRRVEQRLAGLQADHRGFVEASRDSNADDEHDPEGATIAFERSQVDALMRETERRLAEVDEACHRLASGSYGLCSECGATIPDARLEIRPTAGTCVTCGARAL